MPQPPKITVLGSLNMDISVTVPQLAGPGETVLGSAARLQPGGKGANQAVAAARLGASVRMAGCCGDDDFGRTLRSALEDAGVDVSAVRVLAGVASGLALITVDAGGENSITVAPGANGLAGPPEAAASAAMPCDALIRRTVTDPAGAQAAAADLAREGAGHVVITLGRDGAVLAGPDAPLAVPGFSVPSVDSVGAGDAFVAALGVAVALGVRPPEAVRLACAVAATAVTRPGAQDGLPAGPDVLAATGVRWPLG